MTSSSDLHPPTKRRPGRATLVSSAVLRSGVFVVEGMPGAGKTTALAGLADHGRIVLGEYTDDRAQLLDLAAHPRHDDENLHLTNWLRKDAQARHLARGGSVIADRNWLTALGWAASVNGLADRTAWAHAHLATGNLTLPEQWIILDCSVKTSLARRHDRIDSTHPWAEPASLHRLRAFYADPVLTVAPLRPGLADLISSVPVARVDAEVSRGAVGRAIAEALP